MTGPSDPDHRPPPPGLVVWAVLAAVLVFGGWEMAVHYGAPGALATIVAIGTWIVVVVALVLTEI